MRRGNIRLCTGILLILNSVFILSVHAQKPALPDFTPLVKEYASAVVNISTTFKPGRTGVEGYNIPELPEDSPFYDFFRRYFGESPEGREPFSEREQTSMGSGFIISSDGHVITNSHVVRDAEEIIVRLMDRREFVAEVIGTDQQSDIALLKIDGKDLPTVKLGDSDKLNVGEWVLAIGSPFQFDHSVTAGIVSAMGRELPNENYVPFIQTDVAINPGNSGGPLFNLDGKVVGVNSQIYSRTGGFMGLSFAVPINLVNSVYRQLRDQGRVTRGWLGVIIQEVTRELAESFEMEKPHGALITRVLADSPAEAAGFEISDIIISFNDQEVIFSRDLPPIVGSTEVGKTVPVEIIRRGKKQVINVKIDELPDDGKTLTEARPSSRDQERSSNRLNVTVKELTGEEREQLELEHGILIEDVRPGTASKAGVRAGDILLQINNEKIESIEQFENIIDNLSAGKPAAILVQRRGAPIFLALKVDD